jgi:hypothetical protein
MLLLLLSVSACEPDELPQPKLCETHTASLTLSAPQTTLAVGEQLTVTATLSNQGCGMLGLPVYHLRVGAEGGQPILEPVDPEPVSHGRGISTGAVDRAEFVLRAVRPGQVQVGATVSYEVHLGSAGGAYWGQSGAAEPLVIAVGP